MGAKWFRDTAPTADPQNGDYDFGFDHSVGAITIYQLQSGNWVSVGTATTNGSAPTGNAATLNGMTSDDILDMGQPSISGWTDLVLNTAFWENKSDDHLRYAITSDGWVVIRGEIKLISNVSNYICDIPSCIRIAGVKIGLHNSGASPMAKIIDDKLIYSSNTISNYYQSIYSVYHL